MATRSNYDHLVHIVSHDELRLYELIPNVVWVFDLDKHGWWWGNQAAVDFWGFLRHFLTFFVCENSCIEF